MFTKTSHKTVLFIAVLCLCAITAQAEESSWGKIDFSFTYSSYNANGTIAGRSGYTTSTGTDSTLTKYNLQTNLFYNVLSGVGVLLDKSATSGFTEATDPSGKIIKQSYIGDGAVTTYDYDEKGMLIGADMKQQLKTEEIHNGKVISVKEGTTTGTAGLQDIFFGEAVIRNTQTTYKKYDYYDWNDENKNNLVDEGELAKNNSTDVNSVGFSTTSNVYDRLGGRNVVTDSYSYDVSAENQAMLDSLKNNFERRLHVESGGETYWLNKQNRWQESAFQTHYEYDSKGHLLSAYGTGGMQGNNGDGSGYYNTWGKDASTWKNGSSSLGATGMIENIGKVITSAKNGEGTFKDVSSAERNALVADLQDLKTKFSSDSYWENNIKPTTNRSGKSGYGNLGQGIFVFYTITETGQAKERYTLQSTFTDDLAGKIPDQVDPAVSGVAFKDDSGKWYLRTDDQGIVNVSGDVAKANLKDGQSATLNGGWIGYNTNTAVFVTK